MDSILMKFNSFGKAFEIAQEAHKDQYDLAGEPYIIHPLTVSNMVNGEKAKIVALLHDVFEDSNYSKFDLKGMFSKDILDALDLLTRKPNEDYFDYIKKLASNELARKVKLADLKNNMDITRLKNINDNDIARLLKYHQAYSILKNYEQEQS